MPTTDLETGFYFVPVGSYYKCPAITCTPDMEVVEAASLMMRRRISGMVVVDGGQPVAMVTDRDLRNLIVTTGGAVAGHKVREIMSKGLVTIRVDEYVFEAIFQMAKYGVRRLAVLDTAGELAGVISDTDMLSLQTRTPLYLNREIEWAQDFAELKRISARLLTTVRYATRAGADIKTLVRLISHFNDAVTHRIIALLDRDEGIRLPEGAAFLALGSEGRGEQTLRTDQDNAIVYEDGLSADALQEVERFSVRLVDALADIGVPRCPGNTMASNPQWRHSLSEWKSLLEQWISTPKAEHMVNFGMFQDLRVIYGDPAFEEALHRHIHATATRHSLFFPYAARNVVRFKPPLGFFGGFVTEKEGKDKGKINLKKAGIFALTEGVALMALEVGIWGGSTWDKIERMKQMTGFSSEDMEEVDEAFTTLVQFRLERQLEALEAKKDPTNHVDPEGLSAKEEERLKSALKGVSHFLKIIAARYKLEFISR